MLIKTGNYDKLKTYLLGLVDNLYRQTGFTDNPSDPQLTVYKRVNVLSWACLLGFDDCVRNSVTQFQNWMSTPNPDRNNPISANLKSVVYCSAIRVGGQDEWDFAWQRYRNTNVGSEKDILLGALGCTRETWILSRYLEWSVLENSGIRKQDSARVFSSVSSNPIGQPLAYNFLRNNLGSSLFAINNIVRSSTRHVNEQFELDDLMKFSSVHHHELGTATRAVEQAIEQARANVKWMERNYWPIVNWLGNVTAVSISFNSYRYQLCPCNILATGPPPVILSITLTNQEAGSSPMSCSPKAIVTLASEWQHFSRECCPGLFTLAAINCYVICRTSLLASDLREFSQSCLHLRGEYCLHKMATQEFMKWIIDGFQKFINCPKDGSVNCLSRKGDNSDTKR
uniref:ERAP1-like C-terminal domain-containing protein n=1 Tax=Timema bartmani TaxID=61472 RepID=A0A7R9EMU0_9NEOP|nr:unnamed protein product [Timema bartmani]